MSLTPQQGQEYLFKHDIPQLIESILVGLVHDRPDDPLTFISQCIESAKESGAKQISWNSFIPTTKLGPLKVATKHGKKTKPVFQTEPPSHLFSDPKKEYSKLPPIPSSK
uniref:RIIa domain-containing protein n=1 Tax=Ciona savignyi TaxID=51511 RepID=H2Z2U7_CIOSA